MVIGTVRLYDSRSVQWQWVSCSMRLCGNTIAQYYIPKINSCRITGCHFSTMICIARMMQEQSPHTGRAAYLQGWSGFFNDLCSFSHS